MRRPWVLLAVLLILGSALVLGGGARPVVAATPSASPTPVAGNISGPTVVAESTNDTYFINGSGGPAYSDGMQVGTVNWTASVAGTNTTGVTLIPATGSLKNNTPGITTIEVGAVLQTLTLTVEISSTNDTANESLNLTYTIHVVQPFTLTLHLEAGYAAAVAAFNLTIFLDGNPVGRLHIPALGPGENWTAIYLYPTQGLGSGEHTFTASLAEEHGLVTFSGGATSIAISFYVQSAPTSYTYWYVAGIVAFLGALFIFATRVAARRRPPARK
jgi:hypothetical protein